MTLAIDKERKKVKPPVRDNDSETSRLIGDQYILDAHNDVKEKSYNSYKDASKDYKRAALSYGKALRSQDLDSRSRSRLEGLYRDADVESKKSHRMAALYRATEDMNFIQKFFVRRSKGKHIFSLFVLALFFSVPNLTGNVVGITKYVTPWIGLIFFYLGIYLTYFYVKNKLFVSKV